jgi:hypothetical protein
MASLLEQANWLAYRAARYVCLPFLHCPAVFHITHYKAGSQWIYNILRLCCPERIVAPLGGALHFLQGQLEPGKIYPTVYCAREAFESRPAPPASRRFVVIRDLRDTLISWYFSTKVSHDVANHPKVGKRRQTLQNVDAESGLLRGMAGALERIAEMQLSWLGAGDPILRYEDLLQNDEAILERTLLDHCQLPISPRRLRLAVRANRFEVFTQGRRRGDEDVQAHLRKGVAGDWRNHFTPRLKDLFKRKFGDVLIATGYESDLSW